MSATERLLAAVVGLRHYITHDPDQDKCVACPRWDALQSATMEAVAEIERLRAGLLKTMGSSLSGGREGA